MGNLGGGKGRLGGAPAGQMAGGTTAPQSECGARPAHAAAACIHHLFETQALLQPAAIAVVIGQEELSYGELNRQANRLAHHLRALGVGPDALVGVCAERSLSMVVALLAVLKAGGAYVPLDPGYPVERLAFMLADSAPVVLLTQGHLLDLCTTLGTDVPVIDLEGAEPTWRHLADTNPPPGEVGLGAHHLAYVIYTSGSTGTPKGAMNEHRGVVNRLLWMQDAFGLGTCDAVLQKTPFSFDVSVWEFFWPLLAGARVVLAQPEGHKDPSYLLATIEAEAITVIHFVPSMLHHFLSHAGMVRGGALRHVVCSGEALPTALAQRFHAQFPGVLLHNLYGPTEAAVDVTAWTCVPGATATSVPIGRPVANTQIYLLDEDGRPVPGGAVGELHIGGVQVGRGYLNRSELTAERFVPDPFCAQPGARMYKTGDLARLLEDGSIDYLGRNDFQVKLRGFRIELGEIEACLREHVGVGEAVVVARGDGGDDLRLVAYLAPSARALPVRRLLRMREARAELGERTCELPNGMVVFHQNSTETRFIYDEIFGDEVYLKHGITLGDGACVFDVGANIGMFSLFVSQRCSNAQVYAFEPIPPVFEALERNAALYGLGGRVYGCGLAERARNEVFTFYPHNTVISSSATSAGATRAVVRAFVENQQERLGKQADATMVEALLDARLVGEQYTCSLRTVSQIIAENSIERIDLLKIDVENAELDVLLGIDDADWPKIAQLVVEVHDVDGRLARITGLLEAHGFAITCEQEALLQGTAIVNLYAVRQGRAMPPACSSVPPWDWASERELVESVRAHLGQRLPVYMVPAAYVVLAELPLSPNGKLDRNALPAPAASSLAARSYDPPRGETEIAVAAVWSEVLRREEIGRQDNFFELGGHSLLALELVERLRDSGIHAELRHLMASENLAQFAATVDTLGQMPATAPNGIGPHTEVIIPSMLPLVALSEAQIAAIVAQVPGGTANVQDIYPLTAMQEGIFFHYLVNNVGDPYLLSSVFSFDTRARLDAYLAALQAVIDRHDALRTAVIWESLATPVQIVLRKAVLQVEELAFDRADGDVSQQLALRYDSAHYRIDVRQAPLLAAHVAYDGEHQRWLLLLVNHHLVADHGALELVQDEIRAHLQGRAHELPAPRPFRDFVARAAQQRATSNCKAYFVDMLGDVEEPTAPFDVLEMPAGAPLREAAQALDGVLAKRVRDAARGLRVSAASLCHVAWAMVLAKLTARHDVTFGTVLFGRMQCAELTANTVGLFINTLPVRIRLDTPLRQSIQRTHDMLVELVRHENASLAMAQRCSAVPAPQPLFSALLNYRHSRDVAAAPFAEGMGDLPGVEVLFGHERTNYPFVLSIDDLGDAFHLSAHVLGEIAPQRLCDLMQHALTQIVEAIATRPAVAAQALDMMSEREWELLRKHGHGQAAAVASDQCLHVRFERQVARTPCSVALQYADSTLTYAELNQRANVLAHRLIAMGVQPEARVALCLERGIEMVVAILAVLKAGGAYVPLDPAYPLERLAYLVADSAPLVLLTESGVRARVPPIDAPVLLLDQLDWRAGYSQANPQVAGLGPQHLAYIIYTSGSTGQPKGCMVEHRNVVRLLAATEASFGFHADDVWTLFHSFAFDFSVWELWGALLYGARLVVVPYATSRAPAEFYRLLVAEGVTVLNQTPSAFRQLIAAQGEDGAPHSLRCVVFGGEALETHTLAPWYGRAVNQGTQLVNMYGITETTVHVTYRPLSECDCERGGSPIGRALADLRLYILDERAQPVPEGVAGELYVGGAGVARGYLNRPQLTAERFLPDPFCAEPDARMYKTGDLARWLPDGQLDYLGRNDFQVKIRGFRIELGEIEACLREHPGVGDVVVIARVDTPANERLVAYVVPPACAALPATAADGGCADWTDERALAQSLRAHLAQHLPAHMVPAAYVTLTALPLSPNGKLDRKALPAPASGSLAAHTYEAPSGATEIAVAAVWADVLQCERVGRQDNFFDLGGHSLLAVQVNSRLRAALQVELSVGDLFARPVLAQFADAIDHAGRTELPALVRAAGDERLQLSFAQQRLWFLAQMEGAGQAYHIPSGLRLKGCLNVAALQCALNTIVARHEALRTCLREVDGQPVQCIADPAEARFVLTHHTLVGDAAQPASLARLVSEEAAAPFDLAQGPLIRGRLLTLGDNEAVLLITLHHIIADAWSMKVLFRELGALYDAAVGGQPDPLPALPVQYADYGLWQRQSIEAALHAQAAYWRATLEGAPALLDLPGDHPRPAVQSYAGGMVDIVLDTELAAALRALSRRHGTTLYQTLLAAWAILLWRLSGQDDVVVGTPVANRGRTEIEGLIGFFVNTLAMRIDLSGSPDVTQLLARVRLCTLAAQQHQDLPFEQVVECLQPQRSLAHSPLFQAMFAWDAAAQVSCVLSGLDVTPIPSIPQQYAKFDLTLLLCDAGGTIRGGIEYASALFDHNTVARFADYLIALLRAMSASMQGSIDQLALPDVPPAPHRRQAGTAPSVGVTGAAGEDVYEAPVGTLEIAVAAIWRDVLKRDRVGRHDDFFALGGHSLRAVQLRSRLRQRLGLDIPLGIVFAHPVLAAFAAALEPMEPSVLPPITHAAASERSILSHAQRRLWFLAQMLGASHAYHMATAVRLRGTLSAQALQHALDALLARHEALRTTFVLVDGTPVQSFVAATDCQFALYQHDLRDSADAAVELARLTQLEAEGDFDLERGPLIRGRLLRTADDEHVLLITMHHIVADGWSFEIVFRELGALYRAALLGEPDQLPPLPVQYADYAAWQRSVLAGAALQRQAVYWQGQLAGAPVMIELPTDRPRPAEQDYTGAFLEFTLDTELSAALRQLSLRHGTTLFMTVYAGLATLLARLSGQDDIVIGTPVANRDRAECETLVGFFANTLALRVGLMDRPTVATLLARVKDLTLAAQQNQDLPFEQVVELARPERSVAHSPLFQVMLAWQDGAGHLPDLPGVVASAAAAAVHRVSTFDLTLSLREQDGCLTGGVEYASALFDRATVARYLGYLRTLLGAMAADPSKTVDRLPLLSASERTAVLGAGMAPPRAAEGERCIHQLFEAQCELTPAVMALADEDRAMVYQDLNRHANRLAYYLRRRGVGPNVRVAICSASGRQMVLSILAVLKAGGAYVPIDPDLPAERKAMLLDDCAPALLLRQGAIDLPAQAQEIDLDADAGAWTDLPPDNTPCHALGLHPGHAAYVIYTSGSTGRPKGVEVSHANLVHSTLARRAVYGDQRPVLLQLASYGFDVSAAAMWWCLTMGGSLHHLRRGEQRDAEAVLNYVHDKGLSHLICAAPVYQLLLEQGRLKPRLASVRVAVIGGESCSQELLQLHQALASGAALYSEYGPTEACVWSTVHRYDPARDVAPLPLGRTIPSTSVYLLDPHGEPVPPGVTGELYIGGAGVARGYLGQPGLTAERFVTDPFAGEPARMYRTGDLGRRMADGTLAFRGRNDEQVKIRGYRIELNEVQACLARLPGVVQAAVIVRAERPGQPRLVAYYVEGDGLALDPRALRTALAAALPAYMVPSALVRLPALPLGQSGKLDRQALPAPAEASQERPYEAAQGPVEMRLAVLWSEVIGIERVGRGDNFFELGGHSLMMVEIIARMRRYRLHATVRDLFAAPTLAAFAQCVQVGAALRPAVPALVAVEHAALSQAMFPLVALSEAGLAAIVDKVAGGAANVQDIYPLAPMQEGILFHHLMNEAGDPYLLTKLMTFSRREQLSAYLAALQAVMDRHDVLRTALHWEGLAQPVQVVWRQALLPLQEWQFDPRDGDVAGQLAACVDPRRHRIALDQAPLLRAHLAYDPIGQRWLLLQLLHHLAGDHATLAFMQEEIDLHLQGQTERLQPAMPFRDFVAQTLLADREPSHAAFFTELLGDVDGPTAPFGLLDVRGDGWDARQARLTIDAGLSNRLRERARRMRVNAASLWHVAWALVLAKVCVREDVVFGTVLLGRMQGIQAGTRALGLFINTLPVRLRVGEHSVEQSVQRMYALLSELTLHEHASLALAQRCSRVAAPLPLFSALLNYRHSVDMSSPAGRPGEDGAPQYGEERTNYPFMLSIDDMGAGFELTAQVAGTVAPERICALVAEAAAQLIGALETVPGAPLRQLQVLPPDERECLLKLRNATAAAFPQEQCIDGLFRAQVARTPHAPALAHGERTMSYAEIDAWSDRLAAQLVLYAAEADARIAICAERGMEMVAGVLAILKAGAAYVPLDPAYPPERLAHMLADSAPRALLTFGERAGALAGLHPGLARVDLAAAADSAAALAAPRAAHRPHQLAYVIYTSGSTGTPKGVAIEHRQAVNFITWGAAAFAPEHTARTYFATSLNFDLSIFELFVPLCTGGCVRIVGNALDIASAPADGTLINTVPSAISALLDMDGVPASVRTINLAGEPLQPRLVEQIFARTAVEAVCNLYGPTETTTYSTWVRVARGQLFMGDIGRPLANTRIYLLDEHGNLVPDGAIGELYIGGAGVARGYLGRPEQTAERFVADPFVGEAGARMYRTGDLGRWCPDGRIEYHGRNDFQLKIRGFRIELGEIEAALTAHPAIDACVVVARADGAADPVLVAYYTCTKGAVGADAVELRHHLSGSLLAHAVPAAFVRLERLPQTPNGKVDRAALPAPGAQAYGTGAHAEPIGEIEVALAAMWCQLLGVEQVGRFDNFFELGGHSLVATRLAARIAHELGVALSLRTVFAAGSLHELGERVVDAQLAQFDSSELAALAALVENEP